MYKLFYNLRKSPFSLRPDPDFLYMSPKHKNALAVLERGLDNWVGLSAITGEKGTGKSTLIRYLLKQSWPDVTFGHVSESGSPTGGLLKRTLSAFGLNSFGKTASESFDLLSDFMVIDCFWKKRQPVLIIDESLGMESRALEELYMLSTMEPEENRNLRIILAMPPSLWETLKRPKWAHLARRVGNNYQLEALNYQETVAYVQHRLRVAGAQNENLFDDSACKAIFRYSGGNPRLINVLCNAALVEGAIQEIPQINTALIKDLIMQKLWLRAAINDPRGEAHGRSEIGATHVDQTAGNQSDTDNLRPAVGWVARRDKTGQTVSEFIIADIDHASRKYSRLDAEVRKQSPKHEPTGEAPQRAERRLLRVASIAAVILISTAVAMFFFNRSRSSREPLALQPDQDTQGPGLITAFRPSKEARQSLDLPDPIQAINESASVVRKLLAQQESQDDVDFQAGDERVPEDSTEETASSILIEPVAEQSDPVGAQEEGSFPIESKDNISQIIATDETRSTVSGSETPSILIEPAPEQSELGGDLDEGSIPQEPKDNTTQFIAKDESDVQAPDPELPSISAEPVSEESDSDSVRDEGPLPIERKDSPAGLIAKNEMDGNALDTTASSVPVGTDTDRSRPGETASVEPYIAELLARAEQQIAAKHLVTPAGDAALETYQSILEIVPGHLGASQGIERIKDLYLAWARATQQRGLWEKAQSFAERAVSVDPQDTEAAQLLDQIKAERKLAAEVAALKQLEEEKAKAAIAEKVKAPIKPKVAASEKAPPQSVVPAQNSDTVSSDLQAQQVSEIENLLMKAQQQFDVQHLTQPAGNNAWETYQQVLQLDPINQRAQQGQQRIVERIESTARDKQQNGDLLTSMAIIEEGLRVMPYHSGLLGLKDEINRQLEAQRAAQQVEEPPVPTDDEEKKPPEPKKKKRRRVKSFGTFF
jgi:type II secretory pathway predicted ATPase ExeA